MKNVYDWFLYIGLVIIFNALSIISFNGVVICSLTYILVFIIRGGKNE